MLKHGNSTTYYPTGNVKVKSTNKFIVNFIIKLVSENKVSWDEHLPIIDLHNNLQGSYKVYSISINVQFTFVNVHKICYVNI
jgi:hypothetical protein